MKTIISAKNINKQYERVKSLDNVSIDIEEGKFYAIMGHSGSGKTTLINMLGLLDNPTSGEIHINNQNIKMLKENDKSDIRMNYFGFVFQAFYLNSKQKAYENVMIPMFINKEFRNKDIKQRAIDLLSMLGLKERCEHFPSQLSAGEQQRVAIARALANNPTCIFADEPTGNLDVDSERIVLDTLKGLVKQGKSIVVVSHNDIVKDYADKLYYMSKGLLEERF